MRIGLGIDVAAARARRTLGAINRLLFDDDEPGFLFFADPSTCFTDTAGTTQAEVGDPVAYWQDLSGNGNHATQATTANRPILGRKPKGGVTANSVGSGFDITEPGKPDRYYLFFGGASDPRWMQTPVITPGTDKVQVFAGVRKLSDAATGIVFNSGHTSSDTVGSFNLGAPSLNGAVSYRIFASGTVRAEVDLFGFHAPISSVLSAFGDISAPSLSLFVNGALEGISTDTQGSGNYAPNSVNIGRRSVGNTNFFNGEISALTARFGPNLDTNQIALVEAFIASKVAEETIT